MHPTLHWRTLPLLAALLAGGWLASPAVEAAVVIVENRANAPIGFRIWQAGEQPQPHQLAPGQLVVVPVRDDARIGIEAGAVSEAETLQPNAVYCFRQADGEPVFGRLALSRGPWLVFVEDAELLVGGTRLVMRAIVAAARQNTARPPPARLTGDPLSDHLVRSAAAAAGPLPPPVAAKAFLLAVGMGLDDSSLVRETPILDGLCSELESDAERRGRLAVLGRPTMRRRRDLAQHFFVSAGLAAVVGPRMAEAAGMAKELRDCRGGSGFSFVDLLADLAGVTFATRLMDAKLSLAELAASFTVSDFLPPGDGLREGISWQAFSAEYGNVSDDRFGREQSTIRSRILAQPAYRPQSPK